MNYEYIIIAVVFLVALWFMLKKIIAPFSKKGGSCSKGCGCEADLKGKEKQGKKN